MFPKLTPPQGRGGDPPGPFSGDPAARSLRVLYDVAGGRRDDPGFVTRDALSVPAPPSLLWPLLQRSDVEVFWVADGEEADAPGAVRMRPPDVARDHVLFETTHADGRDLRAVSFYSQSQRLAASTVPPGYDPARWLGDVLVAQVAIELRADVLVTSRSTLLSSSARWITEANALSAEQALSVVGLYLRHRDEFPLVGPNVFSFNSGLFRWVGARALVPSGWRWMSALIDYGTALGKDGPVLLAGSLHERLARALRHRDVLHTSLLVPQNNTTADAATEALDTVLVNLVGAFDAAARAAHAALGFPMNERRNAAWQREGWRKKVAAADPSLGALFAPGTPQRQVLEVCTILRNTVHGEGLQSIARQRSGAPQETLVALPEDDAEDLVRLFSTLGGPEAWGIQELPTRGPHVEPAPLVERLLPLAASALDDALRLTPVDRLAGVDAANLMIGPPDDVTFGPGTRARIGMLLGFSM